MSRRRPRHVIRAPWNALEIALLTWHQKQPDLHPYTCPTSTHRVLVATADGWQCPDCDYTQTWASAAHVGVDDPGVMNRAEGAAERAVAPLRGNGA